MSAALKEKARRQRVAETLSQYKQLQFENENILERIARMKAREEYPAEHEADGSQCTATAGERMALAIESRISYEKSTAQRLADNRTAMHRIESAINALESPLEREVLRLRYLDGSYNRLSKWSEVAFSLYGNSEEKDVKAALRLHNAAVRHLRCTCA